MKIRFKPRRNVEIEIDGTSAKELFVQLAAASETFGVKACGHCQSEDLTFTARVVDGNTFPEMKCKDCGSKLAMGQSKDGGSIYPRVRYHKQHPDVKAKKAKEGDPLPEAGWFKFTAERNDRDDD